MILCVVKESYSYLNSTKLNKIKVIKIIKLINN